MAQKMAKDESSTSTGAPKKRRPGYRNTSSKMKPATTSGTEAKRAPEEAKRKAKAQAGRDWKKIVTTTILILFAGLMALSMMLPSFAQVFSSNRQRAEADAAAADAEKAEKESKKKQEEQKAPTTVQDVIDLYAETIEKTEKKVADAANQDNSKKLAAYVTAGKTYMAMAQSCAQVASQSSSEISQEDAMKIIEMFDQAIAYFDQYLAIDSKATTVRADRAFCLFWETRVDEAVAALNSVVADDPSCAPAYMYLGMIYLSQGQNNAAVEQFNNIIEKDPENTYGMHAQAKKYIETIRQNAAKSVEEQNTDDTASTQGAGDLANAIAQGASKSNSEAPAN